MSKDPVNKKPVKDITQDPELGRRDSGEVAWNPLFNEEDQSEQEEPIYAEVGEPRVYEQPVVQQPQGQGAPPLPPRPENVYAEIGERQEPVYAQPVRPRMPTPEEHPYQYDQLPLQHQYAEVGEGREPVYERPVRPRMPTPEEHPYEHDPVDPLYAELDEIAHDLEENVQPAQDNGNARGPGQAVDAVPQRHDSGRGGHD